MKPNLPSVRGFTLIELIIVVIVIGIMAAALAPLALSSLRAYDAVLGDVVVLDKQRYAIERLAREIREVTYDSTTGFAFSTQLSPGNTMSFTRTYIDASGAASNDTVVTVGTIATGSASCVIAPCVTLQYSIPPSVGAQVLTDELGATGNLRFDYYQADGTTPATSNTNVRHVQISLTLVHNGNDYPQRTQVELKRYAGS